jgi:hypothetical protein
MKMMTKGISSVRSKPTRKQKLLFLDVGDGDEVRGVPQCEPGFNATVRGKDGEGDLILAEAMTREPKRGIVVFDEDLDFTDRCFLAVRCPECVSRNCINFCVYIVDFLSA